MTGNSGVLCRNNGHVRSNCCTCILLFSLVWTYRKFLNNSRSQFCVPGNWSYWKHITTAWVKDNTGIVPKKLSRLLTTERLKVFRTWRRFAQRCLYAKGSFVSEISQIWRVISCQRHVVFRHNRDVGDGDYILSLIFGLVHTHWKFLMRCILQRVCYCASRDSISFENFAITWVNKDNSASIDCSVASTMQFSSSLTIATFCSAAMIARQGILLFCWNFGLPLQTRNEKGTVCTRPALSNACTCLLVLKVEKRICARSLLFNLSRWL